MDFYRDQKLNPLQASDAIIADYLVTLFDRNCAPATIKVHRAAISSVLKHIRPNISDSVLLKDLMSRIDFEIPRTKQVLHMFDIDVVLRQLSTEAPSPFH